MEKLPASAKERAEFQKLVEAEARQLRELELERRRDWFGVVLAIIGGPALGWLTVILVQQGEWWSYALAVLTGFLTIVFVAGFFISGQRTHRDERGRTVRSKDGKKSG